MQGLCSNSALPAFTKMLAVGTLCDSVFFVFKHHALPSQRYLVCTKRLGFVLTVTTLLINHPQPPALLAVPGL